MSISAARVQLSQGVTHIFTNESAMAALKQGGAVVTWGDAERGGDSSDVQGQLAEGVTHIFTNDIAMAALKEGGAVVGQ